jgi:predicted nucleotide-binding protein (sugar kinase/HSP70/actin superfamily)
MNARAALKADSPVRPVQPSFKRLAAGVSQFDVSGRTMLLPQMAYFSVHLLASTFRALGADAVVMDTYKGLALGKEFTSGKECFPCQVTLGDVLYHLQKEKERLGPAFSPHRYVYFLPESDGPCRFGMYNKMHRLVLDRFEEYKEIPITYLTSQNSYALSDLMPPEKGRYFRRLAYVATLIADVMDRTVWRVRPYEWRPGMTDAFMEQALAAMQSAIETTGTDLNFEKLFELLEDIVATARLLIDSRQPRRPRIGMVGEIYLRSHTDSNQDIIRQIEQYGGEVVDASIAEWINYVAYDRAIKLRRQWLLAWSAGNHKALREISRQWINQEVDKAYSAWRQHQVYARALRHLDIQPDHSTRCIERRLDRNRIFHFDVGTEAALSIGGALEYAADGFNGIVNVFPFTCMPSTICSAILKPLLHERKVPYLDAPYDGTFQPNREAVLRTFVYQAKQHLAQQQNSKAAK